MLFYTICTLSHIYQAELLVNSIRDHNPDAIIKIGLIDRLPVGFDKAPLGDAEIVEVDKIGIPGFDDMCKRYQIFELCFACKPYYALHFFKKYPAVDKIVYVDSDIYVVSSFRDIENKLVDYATIITPHITQPVHDGHKLERHVLQAGLFNAGFFAVSRKPEAFEFLNWFAGKLQTECIGGVGDQVWLSIVPVFFNKVLIEKEARYNMAGWNVMYRSLKVVNNHFIVNNSDLVFYHYSGFDYTNPDKITRFINQGVEVSKQGDLITLLKTIAGKLGKSNYAGYKTVKSVYFNHTAAKGTFRKRLSSLKKRISG